MSITYEQDVMPSTEMIIDLYRSAMLNRPLKDHSRIAKMFAHSNLIVSAWDAGRLVGICRSLTDFCYCCYVSDLAVREGYKGQGIGRELIDLTKTIVGPGSNLVLLAAPSAIDYYPKLGMTKVDNGFILARKH